MTAIPELRNVVERPFWTETLPSPMPDRGGRDLPDAVDVAVVGGGLMGLSAARRAAELGASVVLLEADRIGSGASARNGGFCHPGFKPSLGELRRLYGVERAETLYRETIAAFEHVEHLCTTAIDADWARPGHVVLASAPSHAAGFDGSVESLRGVDMAAHVVPRGDLRSEIGSDAYFGGLVVEASAGLNPAKLTAGLAGLAEAAGASLHEETRAERIRRQADGRTVIETSRGALIARDVIVGTNGYTDGLTPWLRRRILAITSFIVATEPLPPEVAAEISPNGRLFFDTKHFLYYWRLTPDGRLLFGGRASMWPTSVARAASILQRAMVEVHPQLWQTPIAYAWGGKVAFTFDRMVHAGRADGFAYAAGCCGSGVAVMPWLGMRMADWVGGGDPPAIASLSFPLVPAPYEGRAWFLPLAGEWWKAKDRLAAREGAKAR